MQPLKCTRRPLDIHWVKYEYVRITEILSKISPERIYLFGSAAEGKMTDQSDFDFLLVFDSSQSLRKAQKTLLSFYPLSTIPVDLVWTTTEEFEKKKEIGGVCFIVHREGQCLFEKNEGR